MENLHNRVTWYWCRHRTSVSTLLVTWSSLELPIRKLLDVTAFAQMLQRNGDWHLSSEQQFKQYDRWLHSSNASRSLQTISATNSKSRVWRRALSTLSDEARVVKSCFRLAWLCRGCGDNRAQFSCSIPFCPQACPACPSSGRSHFTREWSLFSSTLRKARKWATCTTCATEWMARVRSMKRATERHFLCLHWKSFCQIRG